MDRAHQPLDAERIKALVSQFPDTPPPAGTSPTRQLAEADAMHGALMRRADALAGCRRVRERRRSSRGSLICLRPAKQRIQMRMAAAGLRRALTSY
jgi:hypothetical protein